MKPPGVHAALLRPEFQLLNLIAEREVYFTYFVNFFLGAVRTGSRRLEILLPDNIGSLAQYVSPAKGAGSIPVVHPHPYADVFHCCFILFVY